MPRKKSSVRAKRPASIPSQPAEVDIGIRLRHARLTRRLKLRELADAAGCSESLLSKIENGKASPSFPTLRRILGVLGLTMGQLFVKAAEPGIVSRAGERQVLTVHPLRTGAGLKFEQLVPGDEGHLLEGAIQTIPPGTGCATPITHQGEEVGYVIEGTIELTVADQIYQLNAGDSYCFRSDLPHTHKNPGPNVARLIVVNTPPTF